MEQIAEQYDFSLLFSGGYIIFVKRASVFKKLLARILLSRVVCHLVRGIVMMLPARGVWKDHARMVKKSKSLPEGSDT